MKPLDEALAEVDLPAGVADRTKRAAELVDSYDDVELFKLDQSIPLPEMGKALVPLKGDGPFTRIAVAPTPAMLAEARRVLREVRIRQVAQQLRQNDIQDVINEPERAAANARWNEYARAVGTVARTQGMLDREDRFVAKFRELVAERHDAESEGDEDAVRRVEGRLKRLTGYEYPHPPASNGNGNSAGAAPKTRTTRRPTRLRAVAR